MSRLTPRPGARGSHRGASGSLGFARSLPRIGATLALGALAAVSLPAQARAADGSALRVEEEAVSFTAPKSALSFTAPAWATHASFTLAGATGAGTCVAGGRGTAVTVTTEVKGGESFTISLGENGKKASGNARLGASVSIPSEESTSDEEAPIGISSRDVTAPGGWGPDGMEGGSATWRDTAGAADWGVVASGGGGSQLRMNGKIAALAGGGGGAGTCTEVDGGAGGSTWKGSPGASFGLLDGGTGGGFATSTVRAGDPAVNAGGGGGGSAGGGFGSAGESTVIGSVAGAGGGGAGGSWVAAELRWDATTSADKSKAGSYAKIVFANRDLLATGNLAVDRPVNASSSLEHASFSAKVLTDGVTRSTAGYNAFSTDPARPSTGDGTTVQEWVEVDLGETKDVGSVRLYPRTTAADDTTEVTGAGFPEAFTIEVSSDGRTWKRVGAFTGQHSVTGARSYTLTPAQARWVRLNVTTLGPVAPGDHGHRLQLAEFEVYR